MPSFVHHDLRVLNPTFDSPLLDVLNDLDYLRRHQLHGTTAVPVFLQLKRVFHLLESLASARIEGNRTTLSDLVEQEAAKLDPAPERADQFREIRNIEEAMNHVEQSVEPGQPITESLIRSVHAIAVQGLKREGDATPGAYRSGPVSILQAVHLPPDHVSVPGYMQELAEFINRDHPPKYNLMKVALSHHRFAWIHPFSNGNGRVVRLLTYAMLLKYGFQVSIAQGEAGRLLNPAAVFCADRQRYYDQLGEADSGTDTSLESWCTYVLTGLRDEMQKVAELANAAYLEKSILIPAINFAAERKLITPLEADILSTTVRAQIVKSSGLERPMQGMTPNQRTYQIKKLVDAGMLIPIASNARQYTIGFVKNNLLRGVAKALSDQGFIPSLVDNPNA